MKTDVFILKAERWKAEMTALRSILLETELQEEIKWYQPCYTLDGKNVAIISSFKDYCIIGFFKGALIEDPSGLLVRPGNHTQSGRQMRFFSLDEISKRKRLIKDYLRQAIVIEKSGRKVEHKKTEQYPFPEELTATFKKDKQFGDAFKRLTPGRQRGYLLHFSGAKQSATRSSRIEKCRSRIMDGKGLQD